MSPSASWAKWVIPIRTEPSASPGVRTHSCSAVYFRSSGYTALLGRQYGRRYGRRHGVLPGRLPGPCRRTKGRRGSVRLGELQGAGLVERGDVEPLLLADVHGGPGVLELRDRTVVQRQGAVQRVGVPDHVEDVRRG